MFVDAVGNRMQIDTSATAPERRADAVQAASPEAPAAASAEEPAPTPATTWEGETYVDVEVYEEEAKKRADDRFYLLPDGLGRSTPVKAAALEADPQAVADAQRAAPMPLLACPPTQALGHLLRLDAAGAMQTLDFPVYDPTLNTRRRYAGYVLPVPPSVNAVRVTAFMRARMTPDVVVLQTNGDGVPQVVVNNFATETIPEGLFRYGKVVGTVPLVSGESPQRDLVVLEGSWARKVLPDVCRPTGSSGQTHVGQVMVEFLTSSGSEK